MSDDTVASALLYATGPMAVGGPWCMIKRKYGALVVIEKCNGACLIEVTADER